MGSKIFGGLFSRKPANLNNSSNLNVEAILPIVMDMASDGIAIINEKGIVKLFNSVASNITGWTAEDAQDLDFRSIFTFLDANNHPISSEQNPIIASSKASSLVEYDDLVLETRLKKQIKIAIRVTPIAISSKQNSAPAGMIIVFHDITKKQKAQGEQSDFISTASHEMRTPVAVIEGYLAMLVNPNTATLDKRGLDYAQKAHRAAQQLGRLFKDLLDVTKVDDRRAPANLELINSAIAAEQITNNFKTIANEKKIKLVYKGANSKSGEKVLSPIHIIYVDFDHLTEILGNLIDNAIKYTKQGEVTVSVSSKNQRVRFSVIDTGVGISDEDISHLFQKFYRVDNSDTREIGGTGLGLYLIKQLTEQMGGAVGVESEYGKGSTFFVEFPELSREQAVLKAQEIKRRRQS